MTEARKPCKRGNIAERSKSGHCQCSDCRMFRSKRSNETKNRETLRKWREKNREMINAYHRDYAKRNSGKRRKIENAWKDKNPEKVKTYNAKAGKKWSQNNRGKRQSSIRARQISKLERTPLYADLCKISEFYALASKLTIETGIPHEVDHIVPLQGEFVSGLHVHTNLQILTREENRRKKNKWQESW